MLLVLGTLVGAHSRAHTARFSLGLSGKRKDKARRQGDGFFDRRFFDDNAVHTMRNSVV